MSSSRVVITAAENFPLIRPGDDLPAIIASSLRKQFGTLQGGDIVSVAQKIVSKAANRYLNLADIEPSATARELADVTGKDPRFVEAVLGESSAVLRAVPGILIVEHRLGLIMANAGIDQSNIEHEPGERVLLLPEDPDAFCDRLKRYLDDEFGIFTGVVMTDSFGRPWRLGTTGVAIGSAGFPPLLSMIGKPDLFGRTLRATEIALADQIAAAAVLVTGEASEGQPVVLISGLDWQPSDAGARALNRPKHQDLFR
jgi:coenzyme F420-0:L-glutamate ligase/coenzyme F420-1:gamma-L-glutamate ligase